MGSSATLGLLAVPASLAVLAACDNPRDCGGVQADSGHLHTAASGYPLFTGEVTVETPPPQFTLCPPGFTYPTATAVRVFAPGEQPLEVTWERVHGRRIRSTFHSDVHGPHRVEVDYTPDPRTGRGPTTIASVATLMIDRSDAPRVRLGAHCDALRRTAQGTWLCDHEVFRGTTRVQELRSDMKYTVSGSTVWGVSNGARDGFGVLLGVYDVARWTDTGSGPLLDAGTGTYDAGREASTLRSTAASSEELVVRFEGRLAQLGWTAGPSPSLRVVGQSTPPWPSNASTAELTWEPPLITISVYDSRPDAGSGMCIYALDAGTVVPAGGCLPNPRGKTADGYWSVSREELRLDVLQGGAFQRVATIPITQWNNTHVSLHYPPLLGIYSEDPNRPGIVALVPRLQPGEPLFEGYLAGGNRVAGAERDYFWWHQPDGGTEVVLR